MATSGDSPVVLLGHPAAALVRAVGAIARAPVGPYAIVGGVAVAVRLGTAHRATTDVDTVVYDGTKPAAVEVLSALAGAVRDVATDHRVFLDGTKIELLGVDDLGTGDLDGNGSVRSQLADAPLALRDLLVPAVDRVLVSGAARTSGWMRSGDEAMGSVTSDQLRAVGRPLLDALRAE